MPFLYSVVLFPLEIHIRSVLLWIILEKLFFMYLYIPFPNFSPFNTPSLFFLFEWKGGGDSGPLFKWSSYLRTTFCGWPLVRLIYEIRVESLLCLYTLATSKPCKYKIPWPRALQDWINLLMFHALFAEYYFFFTFYARSLEFFSQYIQKFIKTENALVVHENINL